MARWLIHDLRNPTQALTLVPELLDDVPEPGEPTVRETIEETATHLARTLELLDRLLRTLPTTREPAPVSLMDAWRFVAALHRTHRSGITLDLSAMEQVRLPALAAVEHELEQILLNLVVNALEAMRDRASGRIAIGAVVDGMRVTVTVEDDGPGIAEGAADRLFEPDTTWKPGALSGLGLAASRILAERNGGQLEYREGGPGARFLLTLAAWPR